MTRNNNTIKELAKLGIISSKAEEELIKIEKRLKEQEKESKERLAVVGEQLDVDFSF